MSDHSFTRYNVDITSIFPRSIGLKKYRLYFDYFPLKYASWYKQAVYPVIEKEVPGKRICFNSFHIKPANQIAGFVIFIAEEI